MQKRRTFGTVLLQRWPRSRYWLSLTSVVGVALVLIPLGIHVTSGQTVLLAVLGVAAVILPTWMTIHVSSRDKRESILNARDEVLKPQRLDPPVTRTSLKWLLPRWSRSRVYGSQNTEKKLDAWLDSSKPVMIIDGRPLLGKTRMAIEWADSLGPEWEAGWLRHDKDSEALKRIAAYGRNTMIGVDGVPPHLAELVNGLGRHNLPPRIRVLLTMRNVKALRLENPYAAAVIEERLGMPRTFNRLSTVLGLTRVDHLRAGVRSIHRRV